jgi:hypothetical protein
MHSHKIARELIGLDFNEKNHIDNIENWNPKVKPSMKIMATISKIGVLQPSVKSTNGHNALAIHHDYQLPTTQQQA